MVIGGETARLGEGVAWLPRFCDIRAVAVHLVIAALVALIIAFAPGATEPVAPAPGLPVLLAVWIALVASMALCALRERVDGWPPWAAVAATYVVVLLTVASAAYVAQWIGRNLYITGGAAPAALEFSARCALIATLVWTTLLRYYYIRAQWQRGVAAEANARLVALQARIRPHFLFNSMNSIAALIRRRPQAAEAAVEDLSELFRRALGDPATEASLRTELEMARRYLQIESLRLADRLRVAIDVPDELLDVPMPSLVLQPLVENAVYHGIESLVEGGTVQIRARSERDAVLIEVINPRSSSPARARAGAGIAVENIRQRLAHHFGAAGRLETRSADGEFRTVLVLPRRHSGPRPASTAASA